MKRMLALFLAIPALAVLTLAGCGGGDKKGGTPPTKDTKDKGDGKGKGDTAGGKIKPGEGTKLVGRIVYDGEVPKMEIPANLTKHDDAKKCCLTGPESQKTDQTWIVENKNVANVVVYLTPPKGSTFEVVQSGGAVVIDQPHCAYIPHVAAVRPGQHVLVNNSANCPHNTKWQGDPVANPPGSGGETIPPKAKAPLKFDLKPQDSPVTLACDFHKWMEAKIFVWEHQYIAVTDANGRFVIENVPTGVELNVVMWHEGAGYFRGGKKGETATFTAGENDLKDIKVKAK